jgi:hypothetical protein
MGWKDYNEKVDESEIPVNNYFPIINSKNNITPANAVAEMDAETAALYDTMQFDEGRSQAGQMIGSITGSMASVKPAGKLLEDTFNVKGQELKNLIPKPLRQAARVTTQVASAWSGAVAGDVLQSAAQGDLKKHTWATALDSAFDAGNEEAIYELLGIGVVGGVAKLGSFAAGKPYMNIQWIKDKIAASGGKLTASQIVDGTILDTIEGLAEVSWGGGHIRNVRTLNDQAINKYVFDFQENFIEQAGKLDTNWELGRVYQQAIEIGQKQHKLVGGQMFEHLDEVVQRTKFGSYDGSGQNMLNRTTGTMPANAGTRGLVSTKSLKDWAKRELNQIKGVEGSIDSWRYSYLNKILDPKNLGDHIDFKAAQKLRSSWLEQIRKFENKTSDAYSLSDAAAVKSMTKYIDDGMQVTATKLGGDFLSEFRAANKFWKTGANRLSNQTINSIINKNPEKVGAQIFGAGEVSEIRRARQALKSAEFFGKQGAGQQVNFNQTWQKMQQGYLAEIISGARTASKTELTAGIGKNYGDDISGGELGIPALKKLFTDKETFETFQAAFTKPQRFQIKNFMSAIEAAQRRPLGAGTFMVTVGQAGLVIGAIGGTGFAAAGSAGAVAALTITPAMLSRALTNPTVTSWLASGLHMKPTHKNYAVQIAKIANFFGLTPSID